MGCCEIEADAGDISNPIKKIKKRLWRVRNCALGWMGISLLLFIIGIILLVYFAQYISTDNWKKGVGITGIAFLVIGFLGLAIGISIMVVFCIAFKRSQDRMSGQPTVMKGDAHKGKFPDGLYPRQAGFTYPGQQPAQPAQPEQPSAPASNNEAHDNKAVTPDEIHVTERF